MFEQRTMNQRNDLNGSVNARMTEQNANSLAIDLISRCQKVLPIDTASLLELRASQSTKLAMIDPRIAVLNN